MPELTVATPIGPVTLCERAGAIVRVAWRGGAGDRTALLDRAAVQMAAYFTDPGAGFDLPLRVAGSDFQRAVCDLMRAIPPGSTRSYGEIAGELGASARAVGRACAGNPIPILIPCHRVLGAGGLGGFSGAGGIEIKVALLRHERAAGLLI